MAFQYGADLLYKCSGSDNSISGLQIPIYLFNVSGGANRVIRLGATSDISLTSELEQARSFKNINLGMPPSSDGSDMQAVLDLTEAAEKKSPVSIKFRVCKFSDRKPLEALHLETDEARIKKKPHLSNGYLKIEISFSAVTLIRAALNPGKTPKYYPF